MFLEIGQFECESNHLSNNDVTINVYAIHRLIDLNLNNIDADMRLPLVLYEHTSVCARVLMYVCGSIMEDLLVVPSDFD